MLEHFKRFIAFSKGAFGPGYHEARLIEHIRKELEEIRECDPKDKHKEWVDVVILGLDGLWRSMAHIDATTSNQARAMMETLMRKQDKNENRVWPNWREVPEDKPIEHVK